GDLAQDGSGVAVKTFDRVRRHFSFDNWIYRMVVSVTVAWLRKNQVKGDGAEFNDAIQLRQIEPASRTVPKADPLPLERMERSEIRARIDNAIAQISPEHRAVILMKEIEEMQYHEFDEALGFTFGTVTSRHFFV